MMKILEILKDTNYKLTQFEQKYIDLLENQINVSEDKKGKNTYKVNCVVRLKEVILTPEEIVRQLFLYKLTKDYNYPADRIQLDL